MRVRLCPAVHEHIADRVRDHEPGRVAGSLWRGSGGSGSPNRWLPGRIGRRTPSRLRGGRVHVPDLLLGVAYQTLRHSMKVLRDRGLIITRQGRATFVAALAGRDDGSDGPTSAASAGSRSATDPAGCAKL